MTQEQQAVRRDEDFSPHLLQKSADILARAFHHDPLLVHALPNEQQRRQRLPSFFALAIRYGELYGESYTDISHNGLAIWLPPSNSMVSTWQALKAGMWLTPYKMGLRAILRLRSLNTLAEGIHKRFAPDPHWYLFLLGVDPSSQGHGLGGLLLQPILARADADHLPCILETYNPSAVRFYQIHGFEVAADCQTTTSNLRLWAMRRKSR